MGFDGETPSTGYADKNGVLINQGDTVLSPEGIEGKVVKRYCAWRYDSHHGAYLKYNSSLLYCDRWKPKDFEVVR